MRRPDEHLAGAAGDNEDGQACDLGCETCVQGFEDETSFLDEDIGKVLDSTAVLSARQEEFPEMIWRGVWTEVPLQEFSSRLARSQLAFDGRREGGRYHVVTLGGTAHFKPRRVLVVWRDCVCGRAVSGIGCGPQG